MLIAEGKPANSEDLIVLWALGLPYEGQHGDDAQALARRLRRRCPTSRASATATRRRPASPSTSGRSSSPTGRWPRRAQRGVRIAVAIVDHRGDPIQLDTMDGAPTAGAVRGRGGGRRRPRPSSCPSAEVDPRARPPCCPTACSTAPGGLPVREGDRVVAGLGVAGADPGVCHEIAASVLA